MTARRRRARGTGAEALTRTLFTDLTEQRQGFPGRASVGQVFDGGRGHPAMLGQAAAAYSALGFVGAVDLELEFPMAEEMFDLTLRFDATHFQGKRLLKASPQSAF